MSNEYEGSRGRGGGWLIALGIILIILGVIALFSLITTALITVSIIGWLVFIFGIVQLVQLFGSRSVGEAFLHLLAAVFGIVVGLLLAFNPFASAFFVTSILAAFFIIIGIYRLIYAFSSDAPGRGWTIVFGIVSLILGLILIAIGPAAGLAFIGVFVGLELIFYGLSWIAVGSALNRARS